MKKNMGTTDKVIRIIIALLLIGLKLGGVVSGTLGIVFLGVGIIFILTSLISFCPLYTIFGINTCPKK
jgi:hypothetical protein